MADFFDALETQSADARRARQFETLRTILRAAQHAAPGLESQLGDVSVDGLSGPDDLIKIPVLRKSDLTQRQKRGDLFGGLATRSLQQFKNVFMSPGPIFEPGGTQADFWRLGRFLFAAGLRPDDIVQNCFAYHLTPAGHMFESGAAAIPAPCLPAGTGQTEMQVRAAADIGSTAYAGTPDFLKVILDKAEEMGEKLSFTKAMVGGGALFPSLRQHYAERGISCLQCYATADLGNIAYESDAMEGMILDEGVIVEIVTPGTGQPVGPGEVGEVVVTLLNPDYPLVRFATGDLSAFMDGQSPCGRTNARIKGWMGRADQTTKVKGMFVRPEQVAALVARHPEVKKARLTVTRADEQDAMTLAVEMQNGDLDAVAQSSVDILKLKGTITRVKPGSLPKDGLVIDDQRSYD